MPTRPPERKAPMEAKANDLCVAVVQAGAVPFDSEACVDKAVKLTGEAAAKGSKVVLFPEAFIGGYPKGLNYGLAVGALARFHLV